MEVFQECNGKENSFQPFQQFETGQRWNYFKHDLHIICLMIHLECRDDADRIFSVVRLIVRGKCGARSVQSASGSCYDYCGLVFMKSKLHCNDILHVMMLLDLFMTNTE